MALRTNSSIRKKTTKPLKSTSAFQQRNYVGQKMMVQD
jgi:hypothetical protein